MENKLKSLFDFQRFIDNPDLARMINETTERCSAKRVLVDEEATLVSAGAAELMDVPNQTAVDDAADQVNDVMSAATRIFR